MNGNYFFYRLALWCVELSLLLGDNCSTSRKDVLTELVSFTGNVWIGGIEIVRVLEILDSDSGRNEQIAGLPESNKSNSVYVSITWNYF